MEKLKIKELESMLEVGEEIELPARLQDFRELQVVYNCLAVSEETEVGCVNYSPGPGGRCSFKDFSSVRTICNWEER